MKNKSLVLAIFVFTTLSIVFKKEPENIKTEKVQTISNDYAMAYSYCLKIRYNGK